MLRILFFPWPLACNHHYQAARAGRFLRAGLAGTEKENKVELRNG
jgi:hypothetical protein